VGEFILRISSIFKQTAPLPGKFWEAFGRRGMRFVPSEGPAQDLRATDWAAFKGIA
jgi:hypothetical protein